MTQEYKRPIPPVMEHYKGRNITDLGIEDHGVPIGPDSKPKDSPMLDYKEEIPFDYPSDPDYGKPVPVIVVNDSPIEEKRFYPYQLPISSAGAVRVVSQDRRRMKVKLKVFTGGSPVYIYTDNNVSSTIGAAIEAADGWVEIETTNDIWAICAPTQTATLHVISMAWTDLRTIEDKIKK